jgi:hypothetical protein
MENSSIIHIISLISYPREGHRALLGTCHVMTLLYALSEFNSHYDKAPLMTLLFQSRNNVHNVTKHALCLPLCTIMTLLLILLTLNTLFHEFWCGTVRVAEWQNKVCTCCGKTNEHTPRVS